MTAIQVTGSGDQQFRREVGARLNTAVILEAYTVAGVPDATLYTAGLIYVTNETGGAVPAFSDGTNWRRVTDRTIIS